MELSTLIENIYMNSKLTNDEIQNMTAPTYNTIKSLIELFCKEYEYPLQKIILHGSYKLNTIMNYPSKYDIDVDIGVTFDFAYDMKADVIKTKIYNFLKKVLAIKEIKKLFPFLANYQTISVGKCAITLKLDEMHIDIVVYRNIFNKQYVAWKDKWIVDEKDKQYEFLGNILAKNDKLKQLIYFFKFLYKSSSNLITKDSKLASIVITEIVAQNWNRKLDLFKKKNKRFNNEEYDDIGVKLINLLHETRMKLIRNFEVLNSGCNENLIFNEKRERYLDEDNTLNVLKVIYDGLIYYHNNKKIDADNEIFNKLFLNNKNRFMILSKEKYKKFRDNEYNSTIDIDNEYNKFIQFDNLVKVNCQYSKPTVKFYD